MKNQKYEKMRRSAKQYAKKWSHPVSAQGNYLTRIYDEPQQLGWWDDVVFRMGSQIVSVWWMHPRTAYQTQAAFPQIEDGVGDCAIAMEENLVPVYRYLGKNKKRKKVLYYEPAEQDVAAEDESADENDAAYEAALAAEEKALRESDVVIRPHMQVTQTPWGKWVDLCMPVEAVDVASVEAMAATARRLLRGETSLNELFPHYTYSKTDWIKENEA
ncbi:MAG: hypothetical protein Q4G42_03490 [Neisseria sp.]|nr:hypothetical protein [Neisseria sp.]